MSGAVRLGQGYYFEEMPVGFVFFTKGRTITEADLVNYVNLTWFTEELFTSVHSATERSIDGRVVPAGLVFAFAEGLVHPSVEFTGQALLSVTVETKAPTRVGDTIRVSCEVIEARVESKGRRGLVRTRNSVLNQHDDTVIVYQPLRLVRLHAPAPLLQPS